MSPRLPRLIVVADLGTVGGRLPSVIDALVGHGARGVLLRTREADAATQEAMVASTRRALTSTGGLLIIAGGRHGTTPTGPDPAAVHLSAGQPFPRPRPSLVGRSCHHADEVGRARAEGCDYVFVSPVYETASKPGYGPALGASGLAALCRPELKTFALGGVLPERVNECRAAGAYGVAVMGPLLREPGLVPAYLSALESTEVIA
jgi:thiamine-phosphate pyrophosphorylase